MRQLTVKEKRRSIQGDKKISKNNRMGFIPSYYNGAKYNINKSIITMIMSSLRILFI